MAKYDNDSNNTITISLLPKEYIDKYGHITVHLPSGKKLPLREAYTQYGPTHIKRSDVPYLTDFSITQLLLDDATTREIKKEQTDRNIHTNFNMTTPDSEGLHNLNRVVSPILKGAAVAGGLAYALPAASSGITNWALANPTLARQLYTGALGGGAFDISAILSGYDDFGHLAYTATGGKNWENLPDWQKFLWNFTNLGYTASAKPIKTAETLGEQALRQTFEGIPINPTVRDLAKAMNQLTKNSTYKTTELFPGTIGWAPRQTLIGVHASDNPNLKFDYNFLNWAEREHGAPKGIYFTANQKVPSGGFLNNRQYAYQVESTFDKPMVQVGDIKTTTKNGIRNQIERAAMGLGADGIIYQDIADNNLKHQTIVKSLNPDQLVEITGVIDRLNPKVTRVVDSNGTIRFQLDSHTPEMPREFVLDPQGDNKFYVHMRTWNGEKIPANMTDAEKNKLFESVYEELPEGAEILLPKSSAAYPATRGTVAGLLRLGRDSRFMRGTLGKLVYLDKDGTLKIFNSSSFIKRLEPTTRIYRVTGTSGKFKPSLDGTELYAGMWFTDSPTKPNRYALETWRKSNRTGESNPLELQYIDIPNSQLERFRASSIANPKQIEFEPEDFIIPLDYPRLRIPYPIELRKGMDLFKLLRTDLSKYILSKRKGGKLIQRKTSC